MAEKHSSYLFTSESVTEGHPDKICDQISDAILDAILAKEIALAAEGYIAPDGNPADPAKMRCACETLVTTGTVFVTGEIRTQAYVDVQSIARDVVCSIGYDRAKYGFDGNTCAVMSSIHEQSSDIAQGVDSSFEAQRDEAAAADPYETIGAGDQGMMFGYACNETSTLMPMPIYLAHRLSERLTEVRKNGTLEFLRPDGKTQVSVRYIDGAPTAVEKVVVSTQHSEDIEQDALREAVIETVIRPVFEAEGVALADDCEIYVNPTGRFVIGGPMGDAGLTGRKIIVDTYGGMGRHGGGAFSGKDCTKVDRSAAYAARWVAKNVVAAGLADRCEVQIAYAIGVAKPVSVMVETFGTNHVPEEDIERAVSEVFDLRPGAIIDELDLRRPIYRKTAAYGHFGRELPEFTWEKTDRADALRQNARPGEGEAVVFYAQPRHELYVFFDAVIMMAGDIAGVTAVDFARPVGKRIPDGRTLAALKCNAVNKSLEVDDGLVTLLYRTVLNGDGTCVAVSLFLNLCVYFLVCHSGICLLYFQSLVLAKCYLRLYSYLSGKDERFALL